jgi:nitrite reductase (NADH) large subunit
MKLIIIGNGIAGITTARLARRLNPDLEIAIYSQEPYHYYPRPQLIDVVAGTIPPESIITHSQDWHESNQVQGVLGQRVVELDPEANEIILENGDRDTYDRLVLATGAHSWIPPLPGRDLEGVCTLRSLEDALAILERLQQIDHVLVLGGGLLGLDVSAALRAHDVDVTVVEAVPYLLPRQLDERGGKLLEEYIEARGIDVITGALCTEIDGQAEIESAKLNDGQRIETHLMLVATGVRANIELAVAAGLDCNQGVLVNEHLQTSHPDIYAVGDVTEFKGQRCDIIPPAIAQARVAAMHITGQGGTPYEGSFPYTTLKVSGIDLVSMGEVHIKDEATREIYSLDQVAGIYKRLLLRKNRVVGAILLGDSSETAAARRLVDGRMPISRREEALLAERFDLARLTR